MNNFKAGGYQNQGSYKSFMPTFINRNWIINDMSVISLLSKADRCVENWTCFHNMFLTLICLLVCIL